MQVGRGGDRAVETRHEGAQGPATGLGVAGLAPSGPAGRTRASKRLCEGLEQKSGESESLFQVVWQLTTQKLKFCWQSRSNTPGQEVLCFVSTQKARPPNVACANQG